MVGHKRKQIRIVSSTFREKKLGSLAAPSGIGPMIIRAKTGEILIDPDGLYLKPGNDQPNFRVFSSQRLKMHGVRLVQCFKGTEKDVLQDRKSKLTINLAEECPEGKKILVLETMPCPIFNNRAKIKMLVENIRKRSASAMLPALESTDHSRESRIRGKKMQKP